MPASKEKVMDSRSPESPKNRTPVGQGTSNSEETIDGFDEILEVIGTKGPYQKCLLYGIVCPIAGILPLLFYNVMYIHNEMDHWCAPQNKDNYHPTNSTLLEAWKWANLPRENGPDGEQRFSRCQIYMDDDYVIQDQTVQRHIIDCPNGWDYDRTDLNSTVISDYDWVCSKDHYLTTFYTVTTLGGSVGAFTFGLLADKYGRKPTFFSALFLYFFLRTITLYILDNFILYVVLSGISYMGFTQLYITPSMVMAELCDDEFRSWTFSFTAVIWVSGMAAIPYIAKWCQNWFLLGTVTTFPFLALFLYVLIFPESPRWLISVGRIQEAEAIIKQIAKKNGTEDNISEEKLKAALERLVHTQKEDEADGKIGVWTLFSKRKLAINTCLLTLSLTVSSFIYEGITLNTPNIPGDQFFNFFLLAIIEIPSNFFGGWLVEHFGRRWTQVIFFGISGFSCLVAILTVLVPELSIIVTISILISKFSITITYLVMSLQMTELFPTILRCTGNSFAATISSVPGLGVAGTVYLGHFFAPTPYIIMGSMSILAMMASSFLPETLGQHLPETIEGANNYGERNRFWSLRPKKKARQIKFASFRKSNNAASQKSAK